ncbi:MAG: hypothetical protein HY553_01700 [Elusimicrobia bacterium]|nr:hypothetical protein [Elusimicrobiota bacterium]
MKRFAAYGRDPWLLAAASFLILAAAPAQYLGRQHDDILFVVASHALSLGHYALFTSPGAPPLHHVWPGVPAMYLPVTWAFGDQAWAYQAFAALVLAACPWAIWGWLRARISREGALLAALVFASSPLVLAQSGCVMSEGPYTLLAAILLLLLQAPRPDYPRSGWVLFALALSRPASLPALPAAAARPVLGRRWAESARLLGPAAAGLAAWWAWSWLRAGSLQETGEWAVSFAGRGLGGALGLMGSNARFYLEAMGSGLLPAALAPAAPAAGAAVFAAAAAGAWRRLRRDRSDAAMLMLALAVPMHLAWGWQYERYLIPLLPLILAAGAEALGRRAAWALGAALACQLAFHVPKHLAPSPVATPELAQTYRWLREHSREGEVLASPLYVRDSYYTGRPSLPLADATDSGALSELSKRWRVRYIVWQDLDLGLSLERTSALRAGLDHIRELLEDPKRFRRAFVDVAGNAAVYEVL